MDVRRLIELCDEPSYQVPRGLSHDERRKWAKEVAKSIEDVDSFLDELIKVNETSSGPVLMDDGYKA